MKLAYILVPAYMPVPYVGATPTPYQSGTVDKYERQLAALSPFVVRHPGSARLRPDSAGRFVHQELTTSYEVLFDPETQTLAEVIDLTLKSFNLETVTVTMGGDAEPFSKVETLALMDGLHPWNEG